MYSIYMYKTLHEFNFITLFKQVYDFKVYQKCILCQNLKNKGKKSLYTVTLIQTNLMFSQSKHENLYCNFFFKISQKSEEKKWGLDLNG